MPQIACTCVAVCLPACLKFISAAMGKILKPTVEYFAVQPFYLFSPAAHRGKIYYDFNDKSVRGDD